MKNIMTSCLYTLILTNVICTSYASFYNNPYKSQPPRTRILTSQTRAPETQSNSMQEDQLTQRQSSLRMPVQDVQPIRAGTISVAIEYKNPQQYAFQRFKTTTLQFDGPFTMQHLEQGLTLHLSLFSPSTPIKTMTFDASQAYLVVGMLVSSEGKILIRSEQRIVTSIPPINFNIFYNGQTLSDTKTFFTPNSKLSSSQNQTFFNKKAPIHKTFFIKKTSEGIFAQ